MQLKRSISLENKEKLLIATSNSGKLKEFAILLPEFEVLSQDSLGITPEKETGRTFFENSLHKARVASKASDLSALGDDSGLIVPALNNLPGLHSARYAKENATDEENRAHLKNELKKLNMEEAKAYFVCVLVMVRNISDPFPYVSTGLLGGSVRIKSKGSQGFGYDQMFYPENHDRSLAEISSSEKADLSHRGKAIESLRQKIAQFSSK